MNSITDTAAEISPIPPHPAAVAHHGSNPSSSSSIIIIDDHGRNSDIPILE
jgi:hypothetical protein